MKVVLELQDQPSNVRRVTVRHDIVIGRGADCNLRLSAPQISRRHCFLRVGRDGVSVTDLDSSNGTFVDGERLKSGVRQPLQNGSQLSLGPIRFLIQVRDDAASNESKKSSASKEQKAAAKGKSEPSTIVADVDATLRNAQAMNLAVEQAGATADSREVTSDFVAGQSGASPADAAKKRAAQLPKFDSRAEIVDLGRQLIAAEEEAKNTTFNPPSKPAAPQKSSSVPPAPARRIGRILQATPTNVLHLQSHLLKTSTLRRRTCRSSMTLPRKKQSLHSTTNTMLSKRCSMLRKLWKSFR